MQITTRQGPAFGVARIELGGGERVRVEAGAMMMMSDGVEVESKMQGGFFRSLKRAALGGESFFLTTIEAPPQGGFVDVAARLPGDILAIDIATGSLVISKGAWIASPESVELDTGWGGFKNLFGSEGGFVVHATGAGQVVVASYGAVELWTLQAGQTMIVDTGHMVAYDDSVDMSLHKVTGGLVQSAKSGEGLVFRFTGPGRVLTQTRNPNELLGWIEAALPSNRD